MTVHTRWIRRSLALWSGLAAAWAASAVVEYLRFRELFGSALLATTAVVFALGVIMTRRFHSQDDEPVITVEDLHHR